MGQYVRPHHTHTNYDYFVREPARTCELENPWENPLVHLASDCFTKLPDHKHPKGLFAEVFKLPRGRQAGGVISTTGKGKGGEASPPPGFAGATGATESGAGPDRGDDAISSQL